MTLVRLATPAPGSPPTAARAEPAPGLEIRAFPDALNAHSCRWPRVGQLATGVLPAVEEGASRDIVEEWGLQSFPASDPPANW